MIYLSDSDFTLYNCDVLEGLAQLEDESVHCVVTSPPYWGLRDYSTPGQLGLEPTPEAYIERMVEVFREVRRVLRKDGTCWLNIGDSYNSAEARKSYGDQSKRYEEGTDMGIKRPLIPGLKVKDLAMMPARLALALQQPYYTGKIKSETDRVWLAAMVEAWKRILSAIERAEASRS